VEHILCSIKQYQITSSARIRWNSHS